METLAIILGIALIFVAAYAADQYTWKEKYAEQAKRNKHFADSNLRIQEQYFKEAIALRKKVRALEDQEAEKESRYQDMKRALYGTTFGSSAAIRHFGQKPAEVIKIELGDDFKELKAAVDSLGSINVLKTELDRAHKREAIYMKRLLVSNAAILAASKKS